MKYYVCNCITPDFGELGCKNINDFSNLVYKATEILEEEFLNNCDTKDLVLEDEHPSLDYNFYKNGDIYFFEHSFIEYFFM